MSVNPDLVDVVFSPQPSYLVGREKIREFAAATLVTDPQHTDVQALTWPPFYLQKLAASSGGPPRLRGRIGTSWLNEETAMCGTPRVKNIGC